MDGSVQTSTKQATTRSRISFHAAQTCVHVDSWFVKSPLRPPTTHLKPGGDGHKLYNYLRAIYFSPNDGVAEQGRSAFQRLF